MTRFVFGDIHGQFDGLMKLIDFIGCSSDDKLFFLGDLIDRGARSADVVQWVIAKAWEVFEVASPRRALVASRSIWCPFRHSKLRAN